MQPDRLEYLLAQKASGTLTLAEQKELVVFVKENDENEYLVAGLQELLGSQVRYTIEKNEIESALSLFHKRIQENTGPAAPVRVSRKKYGLVAAAAVLLFIAGAYFWNYGSRYTKTVLLSENSVTTRKGSKTNLLLPDGTKVWLNADSKLSYYKDYDNATRDVFLTGEAFFEVKKDKTRPFIVHTKTLDVKVLGTVFNVKAYENEQNTEAVLIRGSVEVQVKSGRGGTIVLHPNEKIVVQNNNEPPKTKAEKAQPEVELYGVQVSKADSMTTETQWTKNRLVFDEKKLEDIIPVLERWYDVSITIKQHKNNQLYNGTFENDKLEDVLEALQLIGGFRYKIDKNNVIIY